MNDINNIHTSFMEEFDDHIPFIKSQAFKYTKNQQDANDLVQETLLKAFKHFGRFQKGTNARAWLSRILRNTFINQKRKMSSKMEVKAEDITLYENYNQTSDQKVANRVDDQLYYAINSVNSRQRKMIYLRYYLNLKYEEISRVLKIPEGTVKTGLFKAKKKIKESIEAGRTNQLHLSN